MQGLLFTCLTLMSEYERETYMYVTMLDGMGSDLFSDVCRPDSLLEAEVALMVVKELTFGRHHIPASEFHILSSSGELN